MKRRMKHLSSPPQRAKSNCPFRLQNQHPLQSQRRLRNRRQRRVQHRNRLSRKPWWQKLLPNHRRKRRRARRNRRRRQRKPTPARRKRRSRKPLQQKRSLLLKRLAKQIHLPKVAALAGAAAHRNSGGMAICCTTVFTAHGSSPRRLSLLAARFRHWSKFESKKTGAFPNSKSSSRLKTLW